MKKTTMKSHITLVAALHIGFGILTLLGALLTFIALNFAGYFAGEYDEVARTVLAYIGTIVPLVILFFGALDIFAGAALFSYQPWSRILMIIVSAINCLNIPIGTAKGIYSIWVLMQPEAMEMFGIEKPKEQV